MALCNMLYLVRGILTEYFIILKPQNSSIDTSKEHKKCPPNFEALKMVKCSIGYDCYFYGWIFLSPSLVRIYWFWMTSIISRVHIGK